MTQRLNGIWRLTRFQEYVCFVIITTFLGAAASRGSLGWPLIGVLVANWLAVGFAFMINDVEDAPDDALDPAKARAILSQPASSRPASVDHYRSLSPAWPHYSMPHSAWARSSRAWPV